MAMVLVGSHRNQISLKSVKYTDSNMDSYPMANSLVMCWQLKLGAVAGMSVDVAAMVVVVVAPSLMVVELSPHLKQQNEVNRLRSIERRSNVDNVAAIGCPMRKRPSINEAASAKLNHCDIDDVEMAYASSVKMVHLPTANWVHRIVAHVHVARLFFRQKKNSKRLIIYANKMQSLKREKNRNVFVFKCKQIKQLTNLFTIIEMEAMNENGIVVVLWQV